ncbi:MAG: CPBP family intramembrane metalloprotease [Candidatus Atribacteria bacterium]|nr:CPBP family intramembrane metalloprotease [Candidatus Atribacteria bacterium]
MKNNYQYKPFKYFFITLLLTWISLFLAAYCSYNETLKSYQTLFMLPGLFAPFIIAMFLIYGSKNSELKKDFKNRLFNLKLIKSKYWAAILLIMPFALFLATAISLLFGKPIEQFSLSPEFTIFGGEAFLILVILFLAPTFEELGWRGYGVDSLKKGKSLMKATLIFALLWNLWHLPLFFINGYYQNELIHMNIIYALNFVVSLIPAAILMNWIFYKNGRSVIAIILFHSMLNLFSVLFQTEQFTKCIITIILLIISVIVVRRNKSFFYEKSNES